MRSKFYPPFIEDTNVIFMRTISCFLSKIALMLFLSIFSCFIQSSNAEERSLDVQIFKLPPNHVVRLIADSSEVQTIPIRQGRNIRFYISQYCGADRDDQIFEYILKRDDFLLENDGNVADSRLIEHPACLYFNNSDTFKITIQAGDTVWALARKYLGSSGPITISQIERFNGIDANKIQVGQTLKFPFYSFTSTFRVRNDIDTESFSRKLFSELGMKFPGFDSDTKCVNFDRVERKERNIFSKYCVSKPFEDIAPYEASAPLYNCANNSSDHLVPQDKRLVEIIQEVLRNRDLTPLPTTTFIFDTGINGFSPDAKNVESSMLNLGLSTYQAWNREEFVFGEAMTLSSDRRFDLSPFPSGKLGRDAHGIHVLGIASSLNRYIENNKDSISLSNISKIHFGKVKDLDRGIPIIGDKQLDFAIRYARNRAKVANFSIQKPSLSTAFKNLPQGTLFVMAAGNYGVHLDENLVFPAATGGKENNNVVTVGAHTGTKEAWTKSNFSNRYVDLFAPGCMIRSFASAENFADSVTLTGTSQAAPVVTKIAQTLAYLGLIEPHDIKTRLNVSVDFNPEFSLRALSSGTLNGYKALRIDADIIEVCKRWEQAEPARNTCASSEIVVGKFLNSKVKCGRTFHLRSRNTDGPRLLKYTPGGGRGTVQNVSWIVWADVNQNVEYEYCKDTSSPKIKFRSLGGLEREYLKKNVIDVVFKYTPLRPF